MGIPSPVAFDLYAGFQPRKPYPQQNPGPLLSSRGLLLPAAEYGKFGYQAKFLFFTHVLVVDPNKPRQDAYNTQNDPARDNTQGATVVVADWPVPGRCTAFYVVLAQRVNRGGAGDTVKLYLDRAQPRDKPNPAAAGYPCVKQTLVCNGCYLNSTPDSWTTTASGFGTGNVCADFRPCNGSFVLTQSTLIACSWSYQDANVAVTFQIYEPSPDPASWTVEIVFSPLNGSGSAQYNLATGQGIPDGCLSAFSMAGPTYTPGQFCNDNTFPAPASITITPL
jgi:hypothetical protein